MEEQEYEQLLGAARAGDPDAARALLEAAVERADLRGSLIARRALGLSCELGLGSLEGGDLDLRGDGAQIAVISGGLVSAWRTGSSGSYWRAEERASALAYSPDGAALAVGRRDGTIVLRAAEDGRILRVLGEQGAEILALGWCRESGDLVSLGADRILRRWREGGSVVIAADAAPPLAVSRAGGLIAFEGESAITLLFPSGERRLLERRRAATRLSFDGAGSLLAALVPRGDPDEADIRVWSGPDWALHREIEAEDVDTLAFCPAQRLLAVASRRHGSILGLNPDTGEEECFLGRHDDSSAERLAFDGSGNLLASCSFDQGSVHFYNPQGHIWGEFQGFAPCDDRFWISDDRRFVVLQLAYESDGRAALQSWSLFRRYAHTSGIDVYSFVYEERVGPATDLAVFSQFIEGWGDDWTIAWTAPHLDRPRVLRYDHWPDMDSLDHDAPVGTIYGAIRIDPTGARMAAGASDGGIRIWELQEEKWELLFRGSRPLDAGTPTALRFTADGRRLVLATDRGVLGEIDPATLEIVGLRPALPGPIAAMEITPDGAEAAILDGAGRLSLHRVADGGRLLAWDGEFGAIAIDPGGTLLAASAPGEIRVWRLPDGEPLARLAGPPRPPPVAFSGCGELLLVGGPVVRFLPWREG